ncbi:carboxylesterase/lipase family protein [Brevundimonas sp. Root1279]|uniref:carboxylesterase/lipase family protein n=1 Tax=Brevundimonas sp. Root1279 TaxID=1736443 RepID=UPI0006FDEE54|nr:carboxylesterase family protein [Brevundimonas sp. Root1279]KQW86687.1 carboxylesterase [Brevundimonas sp. Root1279]
MMRLAISALAVLAAAGGALAPASALAQPVVDAPAGSVRGETVNGVDVFRGIPYAAPPVGWRRWKPPVPAPRWRETRDATQFGPACHQPTARGTSIYAPAEAPVMSEDCLSLNVWAPQGVRDAPVLVWIHGGALTSGSSSETMYDGARMAATHGVMVVSINYRLGVLGYLAHPELSAESRQNISGNYGLMDQIAALKWIQANIEAFGGDPDNVTIAGESAGALSVAYLMASPQAHGLFDRAIAQSAYLLSTPELRSSRYGDFPAETVGMWLQGKLGRQSLAELRAMDAQELTTASLQTGYLPWGTIDGEILPEQLVTVFDQGRQAPVPLLIGFNDGEIRSLRALAPPVPADVETYEAAVRERYGDLADAFLALYPSSDLAESVLAAPRDALYGWTSERMSRGQTRLGQPAFLYFFDHGYPAADEADLHAFHAAEIPYVFGAFDRAPPRWPMPPETQAERGLSAAMMAYWANFARTGVPTAPDQPDWPAYGQARAYMAFEDGPVVRERVMPGMFELREAEVCRRRAAGSTPWNWAVGIVAAPVPPASATCP